MERKIHYLCDNWDYLFGDAKLGVITKVPFLSKLMIYIVNFFRGKESPCWPCFSGKDTLVYELFFLFPFSFFFFFFLFIYLFLFLLYFLFLEKGNQKERIILVELMIQLCLFYHLHCFYSYQYLILFQFFLLFIMVELSFCILKIDFFCYTLLNLTIIKN